MFYSFTPFSNCPFFQLNSKRWRDFPGQLTNFRTVLIILSPLSSLGPITWFTNGWLTLIQGWFTNCPMVILSLGSVFSNWTMSCLAAGDKTNTESDDDTRLCAAHIKQVKQQGLKWTKWTKLSKLLPVQHWYRAWVICWYHKSINIERDQSDWFNSRPNYIFIKETNT